MRVSKTSAALTALPPLTLLLLPILTSYVLLAMYARSLPMFDDYQALILFADRYLTASDVWHKMLYVLTAQHDEYKLIFEHILFAADLSLSGHLHYMLWLWVGNASVLAILGLLWMHFQPDSPLRSRAFQFLPVSLLVVQLNYVETLDWAMCGLQMLPVVFFSFLAIALLLRTSARSFLFANLITLLAIFASANGFLLAPVGVALLLSRKRKRRALAYLCPFAVAAAIYAFKYQPTYRQIVISHPTLLQRLIYWLSFCGGAIENLHHLPFRGASILCGASLIGLLSYAAYRRLDYKNPFLFFIVLWMLFCAAGVAAVRIRLGLDGSLTMRYKLYSDLLLACTYMSLVYTASVDLSPRLRKRIFAGAVAGSLLLYLSSAYFGVHFLAMRKSMEEKAFTLYMHDPSHPSPLVDLYGDPLAEGVPAKKWIDEAITLHAYIPPTLP